LVVSDVATRLAGDIPMELVKPAAELLENNDLGFDIANLLQDDPLGEFLDNRKLLLDDFHALGMADLLLDDNNLCVTGPAEVIRPVEVVKPAQRGQSTPVAERDIGNADGGSAPQAGQR